MSFLNSVLSSIETGKPGSITPPPPPRSPGTRNQPTEVKREMHKSLSSASEKKVIPVRNTNDIAAGNKRKAEEALSPPEKPKMKSMDKPSSATSGTKSPRVSKPQNPSGTSATKPSVAVIPSKPPPKGSYADLMMKAKAVQEQKSLQVGLLKHQAVPKEKLSKAEKKKRAMEAMAKEKAERLEKRKGMYSGSSPAKPGVKTQSPTIRRREPEENTYKGTARPTPSSYKGTANIPSRHGGDDRHARGDTRRNQPSRRDEYLATDEEDEGDDYGDYDDYFSDESSDMEAGLEDVEKEEQAALRAAKQEDEEDIRAEMLAKKEKIERKQKLATLAARKR